jgi:uncharacterized membrane protein YdjX (TVP38/TMEM64 family)
MSTADLPAQHRRVWRRAAILAFVFIVLAAAASSDVLHAALIDVLEVTEALIARSPIIGVSLFILFAALSAMLAFVSIAFIVPAAVYAWGEPLSLLFLWVGWILGGCCTYGIGRFLGRAVVRWLMADAALHRIEYRVQQGSPFILVLLFQLALPSEIPGYLLGLVRYSFPKFLLALGLAELPYTVGTVYLGASFVEGRGGMVLGVGIATVALSIAAFYIMRKALMGARAGEKPARMP